MTTVTQETPKPWLFTFKRHPILFSFVLAFVLDVAIKPFGIVVFGKLEAIPLWYLIPLRLVSLGLWFLFIGSASYVLAKLLWRGFKAVTGEDFASKIVDNFVSAVCVVGVFLWLLFGIWFDIGTSANAIGGAATGWAKTIDLFRGLGNV